MRKNVSYYLHQGSYVLLDLCHMYCLSRKTIDWIFMKILQETPLWTRKIKIKFRKSCAVHLEFWFGFTDFKRILPHCKMGTFLPPQLGYHISGRTDRIVMKTLPEMCLYVSPLNFWKFSGSSFAEVCAFRVLLFSKFLSIRNGKTNKTCGNIAQH